MRALITLIAILTVGIVTAQYNFHQGDQTFPDNLEDNRLTLGEDTYRLVGTATGTLGGDLHAWYPRGTGNAYQFRQDEYNIDNNLVSVKVGPSPDGQLNGRQLYYVTFNLGSEFVSFRSALTTPSPINTNTVFLQSRRSNRNSYVSAEGYEANLNLYYGDHAGSSYIDMSITLEFPNGDNIIYSFPVVMTSNFDEVSFPGRIQGVTSAHGQTQREYGWHRNSRILKFKNGMPDRTFGVNGTHERTVDVEFEYTPEP